MSTSKSKLKTTVMRQIFGATCAEKIPKRSAATGSALQTNQGQDYALPSGSHELGRGLGAVVEDSSFHVNHFVNVRRQGKRTHSSENTPQMVFEERSGADLVEFMVRRARWYLKNVDSVHTYVMCFDKGPFVPEAKSYTQQKRVAVASSANARQGIPSFDWQSLEQNGPIVAPDLILPPFEALRANKPAFAQAVKELAALIVRTFRAPPGKRLIVDALLPPTLVLGDTVDGKEDDNKDDDVCPWVVETDKHCRWRDPYRLWSHRNRIGEADMGVQFWNLCLRTATPRPKSFEQSQNKKATPMIDYEPADVLIISEDTDFLPLSVLHEHTIQERQPQNAGRTYVWVGSCTVDGDDPQRYVDQTEWRRLNQQRARGRLDVRVPQLQACHEVFRADAIYRLLITEHHPPEHYTPQEAVRSFVVFATACGNDYLRGLTGISPLTMWQAYHRFVRQPQFKMVDGDRLHPTHYARFIQACYFHSVSSRSGAEQHLAMGSNCASRDVLDAAGCTLDWRTVERILASKHQARLAWRMPSPDTVKLMFQRTWWTLRYAIHAPLAPHFYVPNPRQYGWSTPALRQRIV